MREIEKIKGLIKEFSEGVVKHREQMFSDHVVANRFYEKYLSALKDLTSYGAPGLSALAELLDNPRPIIRVAAATYLISVYPEKAKKVLQAEVNQDSRFSAEALVALKRWERGTYLDPGTGMEVRMKTN